jgi:hypothetical protein|tara:strand:+ start:247 stop:498 length:252 start_codon:yes stop_codon:yes gene_type:complete
MKEDGRKNNGGHKSAGRKSKSEEQNLIEKLSPLEGQALKVFKDALNDDKQWAVKMYFEYMYGKPIETKIVDVSTDTPIFNITD